MKTSLQNYLSRHAYDAGNLKRGNYFSLCRTVRDCGVIQLSDTPALQKADQTPYCCGQFGRSHLLAGGKCISVPADVYDDIW